MNLKVTDIEIYVTSFNDKTTTLHRYASFDFCYHYFHPSTGIDLLADKEKSCLVLGFYLASWGMMRGSSFLLDRNIRVYKEVIEYISQIDRQTWELDVPNYSPETIANIRTIYNDIRERLVPEKHQHKTLVTKLMLGVFGIVPAFDRYFQLTFSELAGKSCGFTRVNTEALTLIKGFYEQNASTLSALQDSSRCKTFDYTLSELRYPMAKIIDMYGFTKGLKG